MRARSTYSPLRPQFFYFFLILFFFSLFPVFSFAAITPIEPGGDTIIIRDGFENNQLSGDWKYALTSRMGKERLDSFSSLQKEITAGERHWKKLVSSKTGRWNSFRDSLAIPFTGLRLNDTITVLLGLFGTDDGFTWGSQTVCLDLSALQLAYGVASLPENDDRIDRIFAHEYTHLLHKAWASQQQLSLSNFLDSVLWECLYEGIGMYRSLNPKWIPVKGKPPQVTLQTLTELYPIFSNKLITIQQKPNLTDAEKNLLHKNLSRGNVKQKWGAFPVAIWLCLEANGDDKRLQSWINKGPIAVIELAKKYLPAELNRLFRESFQ